MERAIREPPQSVWPRSTPAHWANLAIARWWSVPNISLMIPPAARRFTSQSAPNCFCPSPGLKMPSTANRFRSPRRSASKRNQRLPWACRIAHGNEASSSKPLWSMQGTETIQTFFRVLDDRQVPYVCAVQSTFGCLLPHEVQAVAAQKPVYGGSGQPRKPRPARADRSAARLCLANH
jgi:hypothetical protein